MRGDFVPFILENAGKINSTDILTLNFKSEETPLSKTLYFICKSLVYLLMKVFWRMEIVGLENIPTGGGFIIAANHRSLADPPVVGSALRRRVHFMAKEELFRFRPFGWFISNLNAHPLKRSGDVGALKTALRLLKSGQAVILFPEGRRSKTDELGKPKSGVGLLALSTGCRVVPTYLHNTGNLKKLKKVAVRFGPPISPEGITDQQEMAELVMGRIQKMKDEIS